MKTFSRLFSAALILAAASVASASTITIESYGSKLNDGTVNTFVGSNSALTYAGSNPSTGFMNSPTFVASTSTATYNLPANSPWTTLSNPASNWVSFNPGNYPNGYNIAPTGTYFFQSTFTAAANSTGTITVLADDTTSVFLNLVQITPAASSTNQAPSCTSGTPNCIIPATYNLTGFNTGLNTLTFGVKQDYGYATGLDFTGTVATTPEPSSLAFLATGLLSAAGAIRRRIRA